MGSKKIHKKEDKKFRDFVYLDNRPDTPAKFYYMWNTVGQRAYRTTGATDRVYAFCPRP
jgi:hypothetical protein